MMGEATLAVPVTATDHIHGSKNAPITLVEYGDYECPSCGAAYPIVKRIQARLGDRLRFVFRNFPLSEMHPHAARAAEAAEDAGKQGKFWEMHDLIYENQQNLSDSDLAAYAGRLGLDERQFAADIQSKASGHKIKADFMSGIESGVNGTPSFFINGRRFDGDWRGNDLLNALEDA